MVREQLGEFDNGTRRFRFSEIWIIAVITADIVGQIRNIHLVCFLSSWLLSEIVFEFWKLLSMSITFSSVRNRFFSSISLFIHSSAHPSMGEASCWLSYMTDGISILTDWGRGPLQNCREQPFSWPSLRHVTLNSKLAVNEKWEKCRDHLPYSAVGSCHIDVKYNTNFLLPV